MVYIPGLLEFSVKLSESETDRGNPTGGSLGPPLDSTWEVETGVSRARAQFSIFKELRKAERARGRRWGIGPEITSA